VIIRGVPPKLVVLPDVGDLVKRAATGAIREEGVGAIKKEADKLIKGLLGGKERDPAETAAPDEGAAPPEEEKKEGGLLRRFGVKPPSD
jgi:hypothetical protein